MYGLRLVSTITTAVTYYINYMTHIYADFYFIGFCFNDPLSPEMSARKQGY